MTEALVKAVQRSGDISRYFPSSPKQDKGQDIQDASLTSTCKKDKSPTRPENVLPTPDNTPTKDTGLASLCLNSPVRGSETSSKENVCCKETCNTNVPCDASVPSYSPTDSPKPTQAKQSRNEVGQGKKTKKSRSRQKGQGKKKGSELKVDEGGTGLNNCNGPSNPRVSKNNAKMVKEPAQNHLLTEYFPIRRSSRKTKSDVQKEKQDELEKAILSKAAEGLKVEMIECKGRGVVSSRPFKRGEFVVEYEGDLVDLGTAKGREKRYQDNPELGCYMYYFSFRNKNYCVDATAETGRLGRLLNHSRLKPNCKTQVVGIGDQPYLILVAARDIEEGEELTYDYGDRSKSSLEAHPWLAT